MGEQRARETRARQKLRKKESGGGLGWKALEREERVGVVALKQKSTKGVGVRVRQNVSERNRNEAY